ncbi:hypothetical protein AB0M36_35100 [Actinoplanes sp. NPDC051346]|uniref:hypothetical protein n=1 Tax=Actinoplanes sp. NPDC051346 TaxID=3155048 RepID=UPI00341E9F54
MSPGSNSESRRTYRSSQSSEDAFGQQSDHAGAQKFSPDASEDAWTAGTESLLRGPFLPTGTSKKPTSLAPATSGPYVGERPAVDERTRQSIEQLKERIEALESKSDEGPTTGSAPTRTEPLERAMAKLSRYDGLIRQAEGREKADLQRWRVKAAAEVLHSAVTTVDGHVPDKIAEPLREVQTACDRDSSLPGWLDPESFVGMAVIVGMAVLVATGAAPLSAAVVGESMLKETIKAAITTLVAGMLMETGSHQLKSMRERRLASADDQRTGSKSGKESGK